MANVMMDAEEKKRISNEKRLKAIKIWKRNHTVQIVKTVNSHKIFDEDNTSSEQKKLKLFDSDGEDELDKIEKCFKVRPQFEGQHGEELLEMSSQLPGRFKLDERFKEDDEPKFEISEDGEKEKNIKILQSVLGYEVLSKSSNSLSKQLRFDPDDESASKYVKSLDTTSTDKSKKSKKSKNESHSEKDDCSVPISTERYIEVSSDLKEILNAPSTPFSLTQMFSQEADLEVSNSVGINDRSDTSDSEEIAKEETKIHLYQEIHEDKKSKSYQELSSRYFIPQMKEVPFFVKEGDPRLKEGVEYFKRPKSLQDIREEWYSRREFVLELFKRKKRSGHRSHLTKVQTMQRKNAIRQNFQK